MASKETTAPGFASVSRELTGELQMTFPHLGLRVPFNLQSKTPLAAPEVKVDKSVLGRHVCISLPALRLLLPSSEFRPQAKAGNVP